MKGLKTIVAALLVVASVQAEGLLDTAKGYYTKGKEYVDKGTAFYGEHKDTIKGAAGTATDLYKKHGDKLTPVVGEKGKGFFDQGADYLSDWSGKKADVQAVK